METMMIDGKEYCVSINVRGGISASPIDAEKYNAFLNGEGTLTVPPRGVGGSPLTVRLVHERSAVKQVELLKTFLEGQRYGLLPKIEVLTVAAPFGWPGVTLEAIVTLPRDVLPGVSPQVAFKALERQITKYYPDRYEKFAAEAMMKNS